jgi:hypothetical protein
VFFFFFINDASTKYGKGKEGVRSCACACACACAGLVKIVEAILLRNLESLGLAIAILFERAIGSAPLFLSC